MKREELAAIEWPSGYSLELKRASFGSMFDDMPAYIQAFLEAAINAPCAFGSAA